MLLDQLGKTGVEASILVAGDVGFPRAVRCEPKVRVEVGEEAPAPVEGGSAVYVVAAPAHSWGQILAAVSPHLRGSRLTLGFFSERSAPVTTALPVELDPAGVVEILPWEPPTYDGPCSEPTKHPGSETLTPPESP